MNYLALVNRAIFESGIDLDQLDSTNFSLPPRTIMYTRFKTWVNDSYQQILQKREEWYLRNERTVSTLRPRVRISNDVGPILVGDELQGKDSGVRFIVRGIASDVLDPDADKFLDIEYSDPTDIHLIVGENLDRLTVVPLVNIAFIEATAGYDFQLFVPTLSEVDLSTMLVQDVVNNIVDGTPNTPWPLYELKYEDWYGHAYPDFTYMGKPLYVTRGPDGLVEFWPRLDTAYQVLYSYSRTVPTLSLYSDQPWPIPEDLQMAIVWLSIMKYADFDSKPQVFSRARKEWTFYNNKLEEKKLQEVYIGGNLFWAER